MNFTYQTVTQDNDGNSLPSDPCHIKWQTEDEVYSGIIAIPVEVFAGLTQEQSVSFVEAEIRQIVLAKISASSFTFNGTAPVEF